MLVYNLAVAGYQVRTAADGPTALEAVRSQPPDLMILDVMLPGIDGLEVCRRLRQQAATAHLPILMLTAMDEEINKVVGLEIGADDYLTKPFSLRELLARVRVLLRRASPPGIAETTVPALNPPPVDDPSSAARFLEAGLIRIDLFGRRVFRQGQEVILQPKQFDILVYFLRNRGIVLSRDVLLTHVWGYDYTGDTRTVDVHVRWLREKLEDDPSNPKLIQTVRGVGYCFR
jgi:two-component system alkaline phosphatase synthesis response regulator PhoP